MGHAVFIVLHFMAFMCGFFGLFITIPLHVIYTAMPSNQNLNVVKKSDAQSMGYLIGLTIRIILIFIAGFIAFLLLAPFYVFLKSNISWLR